MSARPRALAADKIAVGGRDRTLTGRDGFTVGGKTHRASRLAPFEAGIGKDLVQPFGDRIALDGLRTRHDPGADAGRYLAAARDLGGGPQIAEPAVGARPDEDPIDRCTSDRCAGYQAHIVERRFDRRAARGISDLAPITNASIDA